MDNGHPEGLTRAGMVREYLRCVDAILPIGSWGRATGDTLDAFLEMMETVPTRAYLGAAVGSIALSALLRVFGKKDAALFVGQWPPTFILFALAYKLLRPSDED